METFIKAQNKELNNFIYETKEVEDPSFEAHPSDVFEDSLAVATMMQQPGRRAYEHDSDFDSSQVDS